MQIIVVDLMGKDYKINEEREVVSVRDIKEKLSELYKISIDNVTFILDKKVLEDNFSIKLSEFDSKNKKIIMIDNQIYDKKSFPSVRGAFYGSLMHFNPKYFESPEEDNSARF